MSQVSTLVLERLSSTSMRFRANTSRILLPFRCTGWRKRVVRFGTAPDGKAQAVEFLGTGNQFVADGMHTSGVPYQWAEPQNMEIWKPNIDDIPVVTVEQMQAAFDAVRDYATSLGFAQDSIQTGGGDVQVTAADVWPKDDLENHPGIQLIRKVEVGQGVELLRQEYGKLTLSGGGALEAHCLDGGHEGTGAFVTPLRDRSIRFSCPHNTCGFQGEAGSKWLRDYLEKYGGDEARAYFRLYFDSMGLKKGNVPLADATQIAAGSTGSIAPGQDIGKYPWSEPDPLVVASNPEPYPVDALPDLIRKAVLEVQGYTQAPVSMAACSALAAVSVAVQPFYDVERSETLSGPVSLYTLTVADSGERKSTLDGYFVKPIKAWQDEMRTKLAPEVEKYKTATAAWEAKQRGINEAIKTASKKGELTGELEARLQTLVEEKPRRIWAPETLYEDFTPEALNWGLAHDWPSAGVLVSEGGTVLGSHGMNSETIMRTLSYLDTYWDGGTVSIRRRGEGGSFDVSGARLTIHLQVQEPTLQQFLDKHGCVARGIGFLARCLISQPESTQGVRFYTDEPAAWPALTRFTDRVTQILNLKMPVDQTGSLKPVKFPLSPEAKALWVEFHDDIEQQLGEGGKYRDIRDVASKIADNAARIAALFHVFAGGDVSGPVTADAFRRAALIATWHIHESVRFFLQSAMPEELRDAAALDSWLLGYCYRKEVDHIEYRDVQRGVNPKHLRKKDVLARALTSLVEARRVVVGAEGRKRIIAVNPAVLVIRGAPLRATRL